MFFSTYSACVLLGIKYGTGRHLSDIPPEDVPQGLHYWWLCEIFYTLTTVFIRLSIAVFLLRICITRTHRFTIYGTLGLVLGFSTFYLFLVIFQCHPLSFFWGQYAGMKGSCIDAAAVPDASIAHSAISFTADWILGLLPIFLLWNLQMNTRTKVSVAACLSLGFLCVHPSLCLECHSGLTFFNRAGIAAIIRIPYIKVLSLTDDFLFATTDVAIWSTVEPGLGLVAGGAATLRPLFRSFYSLTSRGTNPKSSPQRFSWRNSRARYVINSDASLPQIRKKSSSSSHISAGIHLRDDVSRSKRNSFQTRIQSPDPFEDSKNRPSFTHSDAKHGGIQVQQTVEVSSVNHSDVDSSAYRHPRPVPSSSDNDMV